MKWKTLSKSDASSIMEKWLGKPGKDYDNDYIDIREELVGATYKIMCELKIKEDQIQDAGYEFDLRFSLKLFEILLNRGFNIRNASDDGVWRYLSIKVVQDIVFFRWGLNFSRFWKITRRIWLKTLWWYIYLSWQGDYDSTYNTLKNNTTDEIVQLIERSGASGYRVKLSRCIMKYYGNLSPEKKKRSLQIFRHAMKLNTAMIKVVEPALVLGGEEAYVKELFGYFEQSY